MKCSYDLNLGEGPCIIHLPPFICQILVFIYWTVLISILNRVTLKTNNCSFFFVRLFWCFKSKIHVTIVVRTRAETLATQPRFSSPLFYFSYKITPGVTPLYKSYRYVPPQRVGFCALSVWKRVQILPILVWSRVWFSRELPESERICHFTSKKNKKKKEGKYANSKCILRNLFCWRSNLSNREVEHRVYGKGQTWICTTWPGFLFTCR